MIEDITDIVGMRVASVFHDNEELIFNLMNGDKIRLYHAQDCCESVELIDADYYADDFTNCTIIHAEESTDENNTDYGHETWTFYRIRSNKGFMFLRWWGESNGYYSEAIDIEYIKK